MQYVKMKNICFSIYNLYGKEPGERKGDHGGGGLRNVENEN
jgi:hypothetical protein